MFNGLLICTVAIVRIRVDIHSISKFRCAAVIVIVLRHLPSIIEETWWEAIISSVILIFIDYLFLLKRNCADAAPRQKHGCK
jgi:hypothetical protein